jgi:hypothetical protein
MALFSQTDIEQFTGAASGDFKQAGSTMSATQWATLCTFVVDTVSQMMNRYCNVTSFELHVATEYKNGKGATGDYEQYIEYDKEFYLSGVVAGTGVTEVAVDQNRYATISWSTRWVRSAATIGDYQVDTDRELSIVRFHNNIPEKGWKNVKITYWSGYTAGSNQLYELKGIALRMAANLLAFKKKQQEAYTLRNTGVRDYSQMFDVPDERKIITEDIERDLNKYKRWQLAEEPWS